MKTEIIESEKVTLTTPVFVEGLPGIGLIGKIAVDYLIAELNAKKFAELHSPHFPHQAVVEDDSTLRLVQDEFYYSKGKKDLIFLTGDTQVPPNNTPGHYEVVQTILHFLQAYKVRDIYTLGGYSTEGEEVEVARVLASGTDTDMMKSFADIDPLLTFRKDVGASIVGASGLLSVIGKMNRMRGVCLLGESSGIAVDPQAAASVLRCLCKILEIDVNLKKLEKKIEENKEIIREIERKRESMMDEIDQRGKDMEYIR